MKRAPNPASPRVSDSGFPRFSGAIGLDSAKLQRILPHRAPFLLIDRVLAIEPRKSARAIKCVSINEPVFGGHFPGLPIFPAVLCIEAMSQLMCVLVYASEGLDPTHQRFVFAGVDKAKFRQEITPGDQVEITVRVVQHRSNIWKCEGVASVDDVVCAEAELLAAIQDLDDSGA